jgi:hypothetical protein
MIHKLAVWLLTTALLGCTFPDAKADPLLIHLNPATVQLDEDAHRALSDMLEKLETVWSLEEPDTLSSLLDAGRGRLLWIALHCDSLRYGDYLRSAMANSGPYREFQSRVWNGLRARAHGLLEFNGQRASLVRCGNGTSRIVSLGKEIKMPRMENMERHPEHPFLDEILVLSLLTPLSWKDPIFDPWREVDALESKRLWENFKPGKASGLSLIEGERNPRDIDARLDSLFENDPRLQEIGWLKKRIVKKAMRNAMLEMGILLDAWDEYRRQSLTDTHASGVPRCPLPGRAVLRLIFLRENSFSPRWQFALCLPSSVQDSNPFTLSTEPGYMDWLAHYKRWRKESS